MKTLGLSLCLFALSSLTILAAPPYSLNGDWGRTDLTETSPGSGLWQADLTLASNSRHEFLVSAGSWTWPDTGTWSWLLTDSAGHVRVTYDANTHLDGWACPTGRIGLSVDPGAWTALGNWNGSGASMTPLGNGIYVYEQVMSPGTWDFAVGRTGYTTDQITAESRESNPTTWMSFTTTSANPLAHMYVDALNGTAKVDVTPIPEPAPLALVACAAGMWLVWLRRMRS